MFVSVWELVAKTSAWWFMNIHHSNATAVSSVRPYKEGPLHFLCVSIVYMPYRFDSILHVRSATQLYMSANWRRVILVDLIVHINFKNSQFGHRMMQMTMHAKNSLPALMFVLPRIEFLTILMVLVIVMHEMHSRLLQTLNNWFEWRSKLCSAMMMISCRSEWRGVSVRRLKRRMTKLISWFKSKIDRWSSNLS